MSCANSFSPPSSPGGTVMRPAATPPKSTLREINEEAALQHVAKMLHSIDTKGLEEALRASPDGAASCSQSWTSALVAISRAAPLNSLIAETLLERVTVAFEASIRAFQEVLRSGGRGKRGHVPSAVVLPALHELSCAYERVAPSLREWCAVLQVPGVATLFAVHVRCALLQTDLMTGEEPPGKRALLAFLRQYGSGLLMQRNACDRAAGSGVDVASDRNDEGQLESTDAAASHSSSPSGTREAVSTAFASTDPVVSCLHRLTLSQASEVKQLWREVLEAGIREKLRELSDDFSTHFLHEPMAWLKHSVEPFVTMVLNTEGTATATVPRDGETERGAQHRDEVAGSAVATLLQTTAFLPNSSATSAASAERAAWSSDMRQLLLRSYARRRLDSFWEILSDYPDSIPALEDMQYCLQANPESGLKRELIRTVRLLLSSRLHRAGTRTEDILAILTNTIHSFCVLFPRNEQSSVVFSVISDTLDHLRRRKDCVTAIVQAVMQPGSAVNAAPPPPPPPPRPSSSKAQNSDEDGGNVGVLDLFGVVDHASGRAGGATVGGVGGREGEQYRTASRDRPDVLRVLLTSIHRRALVEEYQQVLAEQLLQKPLHEFDTTPEEEVLERLKQVFGEAVLDRCAVMVRDMQMSRRISQQLREQRARRLGLVSAAAMPSASSVSVLSMTTWPPLSRCCASSAFKPSASEVVTSVAASPSSPGGAAAASTLQPFRPHPSLQAEMDALAETYKKLKDNQRLHWLPALGRVELELTQRDPSKGNTPVTVSQTLSVLDASIVLCVKDLERKHKATAASSAAVAAMVPVSDVAATMAMSVDDLRSHMQRLCPSILVMPTRESVSMQLNVASAADYVFAEDKTASEEEAKPAGLPPERLKLMERMVTSLLKTRGPQTSVAIHSSLKLLAKFEGTQADLVELLQSFLSRGLIVLNEAKLYALPLK